MENVVTNHKLNLRLLGFLLAYPIGYLYWELLTLETPNGYEFIGISIFSVLFIIWNEILLRGHKEKAAKGTYFWYAVMVIAALTSSLAPNFGISVFAVHLCAIYSVLFANNNLLGGKTGGLIPFDILNGAFIKGIGNFWRFFYALFDIRKAREELNAANPDAPKGKKINGAATGAAIVVIVISIIFFIIAIALLCTINQQFDDAVSKILDFIFFDVDISVGEIIIKLIMAGPVAVLLYSALVTCAASDGTSDRARGKAIVDNSRKLRLLKDTLINVVLGCFILIYVIFFVFEGSYIFGALLGRIPEGFNVVEYARNGFFELIWVMVINMLLYLLVNAFTKDDSKTKLNKGLLITLMSTSIIFATVSFVKLGLYFNKFGYTPKRILAMWGAVVILVGSVFVIVSIIKNKSYARNWILFTVISYLILCLISGVFQYNDRKEYFVNDRLYIYVHNVSEDNIESVQMSIMPNMLDYYDLGTASSANSNYTLISSGSGYNFGIDKDDLPRNFLHGRYSIIVYVKYEGDSNIYTNEFIYDPTVSGIDLGDHHYSDYSYTVDLNPVY